MKLYNPTLVFLLAAFPHLGYAFEFGIGIHPASVKRTPDEYIHLIKDVGFNSLRTDYPWNHVETQVRAYKADNSLQSAKNIFTENAPKNSVSSLLILDYGNALHTPYGYPSNDTEIQAFVSYANWVSVQMAGKVDYYEIWNEWLQATGVPGKRKPTSDPTIYTNLVKYTYKAIKKNDSRAKVLIGSINPTIPEYMKWIEKMSDLDILKYADGVSVHAYFTRKSQPNNGEPEDAINTINNLQDLIIKKTGKEFPLYITEIGYPTMYFNRKLSEDNVAQQIIKFSLLARSKSYIKGLWWYDLINDGNDLRNPEHNYGFYRADDSPKMIVSLLRPLSRAIENEKLKFTSMENNDITSVSISSNAKEISISWTKGEPIDKVKYQNFIAALEKL